MVCRLFAIIALFAICLALPKPSEAQTGLNKAGWQLTFDEEFTGSTLDMHKWTASEGTFPTREDPLQYFLPGNVRVGSGHLRITSEHRLSHGFQYTSGEIRTLDKFSQQYGRLETRCRFPNALGAWSAVYLLPANDDWPPEIDAAEHIGRDPFKIYLTNHWKDGFGQHQQANRDWLNPTTDWSAWHTYALEWQPNTVSWYIDGILRGKAFGPVSDLPMYIRINLAVGGGFAGEPQPKAWPQTLEVAYVRMYRRAAGPKPIFGPVPHVLPPAPPPQFVPPVSQVQPAAMPQDHGPDGWNVFILLAGPLGVWFWMRRRLGPEEAWRAALAAGVGISAVQYLLFRLQIVQWAALWIALPLLLAELHGILHTLGLQYTLWPRSAPVVYDDQNPTYSPIFIFIPTVNEGDAVLEPTILGALATRTHYLTRFPEARVTIAICNDGFVAEYPNWMETEQLAERLGVTCLTRPVGGGAKAGNIEFARQALGATGDALLVLFDADQVAEQEFLAKTILLFRDYTIGWVQTGQYYRNLGNSVARWANDQQALFYRVLCPGKASLNAAFICGTNVVIRAEALDEIGGLPQDSVTEDFAASLLLHGRWRSLFLPEILAQGLGPMDLKSYFAQQGRWATGTLGVLRRHWRRLLLREPEGLSQPQRIQYLLACTHYLSGLRDLIYLLVPFLFLLLGVSAIQGTTMPTFLWRFLPYWAFSQIAFWSAARGKTTFRGLMLSFGSFPVLLASLLLVVFGQRVRFAITPKHRSRTGTWQPLFVQLFALVGCFIGLLMAANSLDNRNLVLLSAVWLLYMQFLLSGVVWLGIWDWQAGKKIALPLGPGNSGLDGQGKMEEQD